MGFSISRYRDPWIDPHGSFTLFFSSRLPRGPLRAPVRVDTLPLAGFFFAPLVVASIFFLIIRPAEAAFPPAAFLFRPPQGRFCEHPPFSAHSRALHFLSSNSIVTCFDFFSEVECLLRDVSSPQPIVSSLPGFFTLFFNRGVCGFPSWVTP